MMGFVTYGKRYHQRWAISNSFLNFAEFSRRRSAKTKVAHLVGLTLKQLAKYKLRSAAAPLRFPDPYLAVSQLRDSVLANEFDGRERQRLWSEVQKVVEGNSNVRARQVELEGEWLRAWEWVGAVPVAVGVADNGSDSGLVEDYSRPIA